MEEDSGMGTIIPTIPELQGRERRSTPCCKKVTKTRLSLPIPYQTYIPMYFRFKVGNIFSNQKEVYIDQK